MSSRLQTGCRGCLFRNSPGERERRAILGQDYGQAGAIDFFGAKMVLPILFPDSRITTTGDIAGIPPSLDVAVPTAQVWQPVATLARAQKLAVGFFPLR